MHVSLVCVLVCVCFEREIERGVERAERLCVCGHTRAWMGEIV
jgi:hypothetical protein